MLSAKYQVGIFLFLLGGIGAAYQLGLRQTEWTVEKSGSKIMAAGTYVTNNELEKGYLKKEFVAENYLAKKIVNESYAPIAKLRELEAINANLKGKADLVGAALKSADRQLTYLQVWAPKNPQFSVVFVDYLEGVNGKWATIQLNFVDSQPFKYNLTEFNTPKNFEFDYEGIAYTLSTTLRKRRGEPFIEANLRQTSPEVLSTKKHTDQGA